MNFRPLFTLLVLCLAPVSQGASLAQQLQGHWEGFEDGKSMAMDFGQDGKGQLLVNGQLPGPPGTYFTYTVDERAFPPRLELVGYIGGAPTNQPPLRFLVRLSGPDQIELAMVAANNDAATFATIAPKDRAVLSRVSNNDSASHPTSGVSVQPPSKEMLAALRRTDQYYTGYARYISALQRIQKSPDYAQIGAINSKGLSEEEIRKSLSKANIEYLYALAAREDYLLTAIMTAPMARVAAIEAHCGREQNGRMLERAESLYWNNQRQLPLDKDDRANRIADYKEKYELYRLQPLEIDALECQAHNIRFEGAVRSLLEQLDPQQHPELTAEQAVSLYESRFK